MALDRRTFFKLVAAGTAAAALPAVVTEALETDRFAGWLLADGASLEISRWPELHDAIGRSYTLDREDPATFRLPHVISYKGARTENRPVDVYIKARPTSDGYPVGHLLRAERV